MSDKPTYICSAKQKYTINMDSATAKTRNKPRKSVPLTEEEQELLKKHIAAYTKPIDAAIALGIDRNVMQRVELMGSGSEITIQKIRAVLNLNNV